MAVTGRQHTFIVYIRSSRQKVCGKKRNQKNSTMELESEIKGLERQIQAADRVIDNFDLQSFGKTSTKPLVYILKSDMPD